MEISMKRGKADSGVLPVVRLERQRKPYARRMAVVAGSPWHRYSGADLIAERIHTALTTPPNGKVRTLKDMTPEEKAALEAQYGCKISQK